MVEQWNSDGGTVEQCWWNRETVIVEQWNSDGDGGTVLVEQRNSDSGTVMVEPCGRTVEQRGGTVEE